MSDRDVTLSPEENREELERSAKIERDQEVEDFKWLVAHAQGRRLLWRLLERSGVYQTSYNGSANDTLFREGMRNLGLEVLSELHEISPQTYSKMLTEHARK